MFSVIGAFVGAAGKWVMKNPIILLAVIFCAAFIMIVVSKNAEIKAYKDQIDHPTTGYKKRIEVAITTIGTLRNNNAVLTDSVQRQSDSIMALKVQGDAAGVRFDGMMAGMATANASTARRLDQLRAARPGIDKCVSAFDLVQGAIQ